MSSDFHRIENHPEGNGWKVRYTVPHNIDDETFSLWTAEDFSNVKAFHCIRCKKPYSKTHKEKCYKREDMIYFREYSARSGFCPDCVKAEAEKPNNWFKAYVKQKGITLKFLTRSGYAEPNCLVEEVDEKGNVIDSYGFMGEIISKDR